MEQNILDERPYAVRTRFELAASRMVESWLKHRAVRVSPADLAMAAEFLEHLGCRVEAEGLWVRVMNRDGCALEMTREDAVVLAVRRLAGRVV